MTCLSFLHHTDNILDCHWICPFSQSVRFLRARLCDCFHLRTHCTGFGAKKEQAKNGGRCLPSFLSPRQQVCSARRPRHRPFAGGIQLLSLSIVPRPAGSWPTCTCPEGGRALQSSHVLINFPAVTGDTNFHKQTRGQSFICSPE